MDSSWQAKIGASESLRLIVLTSFAHTYKGCGAHVADCWRACDDFYLQQPLVFNWAFFHVRWAQVWQAILCLLLFMYVCYTLFLSSYGDCNTY
jgi:hypothetical protein